MSAEEDRSPKETDGGEASTAPPRREEEDDGDSEEDEDDEEEEEELADDDERESDDDEEEARKLAAIVQLFTPEQLERYEAFRRSHLPRRKIQKTMRSVLRSDVKVSDQVAIVVGGVAKQYAGEIVEEARMRMAERGEKGPVGPEHLREAHRTAGRPFTKRKRQSSQL